MVELRKKCNEFDQDIDITMDVRIFCIELKNNYYCNNIFFIQIFLAWRSHMSPRAYMVYNLLDCN